MYRRKSDNVSSRIELTIFEPQNLKSTILLLQQLPTLLRQQFIVISFPDFGSDDIVGGILLVVFPPVFGEWLQQELIGNRPWVHLL